MTMTIPYAWLKSLPPTALKTDEGLPFGVAPPFPWEQLGAVLGKLFQLEALQITTSEAEFRAATELIDGLGSQPIPLYIDIAPLSGSLCLLMPRNDWEQLMSLLLTKKIASDIVIDDEYLKGFYHFLALEVFNVCGKLEYDKGLSPHILDKQELPNEPGFCFDISIKADNHVFHGRLVMNEMLRQAWNERYAERALATSIPKALADKIFVTLNLEAGQTTLKYTDWMKAAAGDFLVLDYTGMRPEEGKSMITITLNKQPLFLAQAKGGNIKILDYPLYHEAAATMVNQDDDDMDDFDIDFDTEEASMTEEHALPSVGDEDLPTVGATQGSTIGATRQTTIAEEITPSPLQPKEKKKLNIEELSVNVVVEVGRLEMSIQKLSELQPGSILDLNIHPEDGVDLTINGRVVAKGELLKIGDVLGVRLLDIG